VTMPLQMQKCKLTVPPGDGSAGTSPAIYVKEYLYKMCGIVGYTGAKDALPILVSGLSTLEYRGYDSAGLAWQTASGLGFTKTKGRIAVLKEKLDPSASSRCGIGHTRWATHGEPSDINAHPHLNGAGNVAVVHNGIIENYMELRRYVAARGCTIISETDSEVVAHLFGLFYEGDGIAALKKTVSMLKGAFALGIVTADAPGEIYCTRHDNPLIIGVGREENMIASDIPAIIGLTRDYILLDDGQLAKITADKVSVYSAEGEEVAYKLSRVDWDVSAAEKGGYDHFMIKEIFEQPTAVKNTVQHRIKDGLPRLSEAGLTPDLFRDLRSIHIVACGSALHAGLVGKTVIEKLARIPVIATVASEFRYQDPIIDEKDLCIIISQSGETADTLAGLREAKRRGARTVSVVNVVGSAAAREADHVLYTVAGPEIAVATTKAYSAQLAAMYLIAVQAALGRGSIDEKRAAGICEEIAALPGKITEVLDTRAEEVKALAAMYHKTEDCFFIGRGIDFAGVQEASLKLKEISYIHSEAYAGGELKHGTISLVEDGTLVLAMACDPDLYDKTVSNIKAVRARGARVILITNGDFTADGEVCDHVINIPKTLPELSASVSLVPMQLFAYHVGVMRGCDIDKPRNLAKSVTVE